MNLSVVMGVVDKMKAPLAAMTQNTNKFTREISVLQEKQAETSAQMAMISGFQNTQKVMQQNAQSIEVAAEKLAELEAKSAKAEKPSAKLTAQIEKQRAALNLLNDDQAHYQGVLNKASGAMKKAGINTSKLDDEFDRLNRTYAKQVESLNKVGASYDKVKQRLQPLQNLANKISLPSMESVSNAAASAAAPAAAVGVLGLVINDTASEIQSLSKVAQQLKMPTEDLQALRHQATAYGAEADDMDSALREMALRWGEMKTLKSGAMHDYFKDTKNPEVFKSLMNAKDELSAYKIIVDEIAKEKDISKRNFMMDEMFGGDSEKLIGVLSKGTQGLIDSKKQLSDLDAFIDDGDIKNANSYKASLSELKAVLNAIKINVFVPLMGRLADTFKAFSENMKNADFREGVIKQVSDALLGIYNAIAMVGKGVILISKYWREFAAGLAIAKIGMIALNAAILANPISLLVTGLSMAAVGVAYVISKFVSFQDVIDGIKSAIGSLFTGIKRVISMIPDSFIPDKWRGAIDNIRNEIKSLDDISANPTVHTTANGDGFKPISSMAAYKPLGNSGGVSKSQVDVTIKSDNPLIVDNLKADKKTDLKINTGNMLLMY